MVKELNLKNDLASDRSVFKFYRDLLKVRASEDALILGSVEFISKESDNCFITLREYEGQKVIIVCNFEEEQNIQTGFSNATLLLTNNSTRNDINGVYKPFEIAVYKM